MANEKRPAKRRLRARRIVVVSILLVLLLLLIDQTGIRELSGRDFPVTDVLAPTLRTHVEELAKPEWQGRRPGTDGNAKAAKYLESALISAGVGPFPSLGTHLVPLPDSSLGHNVLGWIAPDESSESRGVIVLGAHFDHIGPTEDGMLLGADDNASAVAVVLGVLPQILAMKSRPFGVAVALFNTEESPFFNSPRQGSRAFVAELPREIGTLANVRLAIVMDLIGGVVWRRTADTIYACGAEKAGGLPAVVDAVREDGLDVRRLGIHAVENIPGYSPQAFSDYDVFRDNRIPFLFLSSGRSPRYHRPSDIPETLYYDRMARTSRWIGKFITQFAQSSEPFIFQPKGEDYATDRDSLRWAFDAATKPWSTISGTSPISFARLVGDRSRLEAMSDPAHVFTSADVLSIERASFRLQCLLYRYPVCFTL